MGLTLDLAARIAGVSSHDFNDAALEAAQLGFTDTIATTFAGAEERATQVAFEFASRRVIPSGTDCALPWLRSPLPVSMAALVSGTAGHALDYDDVALSGHPSTVLVPALVCEGMAKELSGRTCLEAYVVGYQVWAELFRREPASLHTKGWHPTAWYGVVAATAALAYMRRLNAHDTATALATAASFASGVVSNFGTMTKPLHAGRAASLAFEALEYADLGLTASPDALEHPSGLLNALSPSGHVDRAGGANWADEWAIVEHGLCIKQYPVCYGAHRAIDGMISLAHQHNLKLTDVRAVSVGLGPAQLSMLRNRRPQTELEAKFSIEFAMAAALDQRNVGLAQLTDEYVSSPDIQRFFERVTTWCVEEPDPNDATFSKFDEVQLTLTDGRGLTSGQVYVPKGHADNPMEPAALRKKFMACLARFNEGRPDGAFVCPDSDSLFQRVASLADCTDMSKQFFD